METTVAVPRRSREREGYLGMPDNSRAQRKALVYLLAVCPTIFVHLDNPRRISPYARMFAL